MKTAGRLCVAAFVAALGFGFTSGVCAQEAAPDSVNPVSSSVPGPGSVPEVAAMPDAAPIATAAVSKKEPEKSKRNSASSSRNIPDAVSEAVGRLNASTQDITLEDLNAAREAVVKLDVLIDIEKRLNDLAKLRQERQDKAAMQVAPIAAAIPASALAEPAPVASSSSAPDITIPSEMMPSPSFSTASLFAKGDLGSEENVHTAPIGISSAIEVSRITGAAGSYMALVRDGQRTRSVRPGDKLADGTQIVAISREGLTLSKDKEKKTLQVRDVTRVFGGG